MNIINYNRSIDRPTSIFYHTLFSGRTHLNKLKILKPVLVTLLRRLHYTKICFATRRLINEPMIILDIYMSKRIVLCI